MDKLISACGINCAECEAYLATINDDEKAREEVASKWSEIYDADCSPMDCVCEGCMEDGLLSTAHATSCGIRACVVEKKLNNCSECKDFACEQLERFFELVPGARKTLEDMRQ